MSSSTASLPLRTTSEVETQSHTVAHFVGLSCVTERHERPIDFRRIPANLNRGEEIRVNLLVSMRIAHEVKCYDVFRSAVFFVLNSGSAFGPLRAIQTVFNVWQIYARGDAIGFERGAGGPRN